MNGAQALVRTLVGCGVETCFANPGTSEMHFVAALDAVPEMRGVLCLFEGTATGAADGYGRMTGRPAAALLHLGPGLSNGLANLHNAHRARTPLVAVVGDHATWHRHDSPLESDIDSLARPVSAWVRRYRCAPPTWPRTPATRSRRRARRPAAWPRSSCPPTCRGAKAGPSRLRVRPGCLTRFLRRPSPTRSRRCVAGDPCVILLSTAACRRAALEAASRIAVARARLIGETMPTRHERGAGIPALDRLAYLPEYTTRQLADARHLILCGARYPVSYFGYPGMPSTLAPADCEVHELAEPAHDIAAALAALADLVAAGSTPAVQPPVRPGLPDGALTAETAAAVIGALLPEGAIVSDEAATSGRFLPAATAGAPPHDWLALTGGAIGQGLPLAVGAAVACPGRPVLALEADGSAMYTISSLWTHAREGLDITTVVFNNRSYAILGIELARLGAAAAGKTARSLLSLDRPPLDFTALAAGMGVQAARVTTAQEFATRLRNALAEPGPHLIEAIVPALRPVGVPG